MPKPMKGPRLGAGPADHNKILSNLAKSLIEHGSITTTQTRAKALQPYIERLITKAKKGDINSRRVVAKKIGTQVSKYERGNDAVYMLMNEVVPRLDPQREGGYTRIVKLGNRRGDDAPMAQISIIFDKVEKKAAVKDVDSSAKKVADTKESDKEDDVVDDKADDKAQTDEVEADDTDAAEADEAQDAADADAADKDDSADDADDAEKEDK